MNIQIHASDFTLTDGLREHIAWRVAYATNHGRDAVSRIIVHLSDVNGPRGGVDKRCGVELRLKGAPSLVVDDVQADLYVAIDRAFERVSRSLHRRLARRRCFSATSAVHDDLPEQSP